MSTRLGLEGIVRPIGLNEQRRCTSREAGGGRRLGQQETAMNAKNRFVWTAIEQPYRPDTLPALTVNPLSQSPVTRGRGFFCSGMNAACRNCAERHGFFAKPNTPSDRIA